MKNIKVENLKKKYPKGTKIECIKMNDPYNPIPSGTKGEVDHVDDIGTIHMKWENGSSLGIIVGEDDFKVIQQEFPKTYDYKFVDFLAHRNVVKITNEREFKIFVSFLKKLGMVGVLNNRLTFKEWEDLSFINSCSKTCFLFEYDNSRGLTWSDDEHKSTEWYGKSPLTVEDLKG